MHRAEMKTTEDKF